MPFTEEDRQEFKEIFHKLRTSFEESLENHRILPRSITHNGEKVGLRLTLYELGEEASKEGDYDDAQQC